MNSGCACVVAAGVAALVLALALAAADAAVEAVTGGAANQPANTFGSKRTHERTDGEWMRKRTFAMLMMNMLEYARIRRPKHGCHHTGIDVDVDGAASM